MSKKKKNIIPNVVIFILSLFFFIASFTIKLTNIDKVVGSRLFPQIVTLLLMALSLFLIIADMMENKRNEASKTKVEEDNKEIEEVTDKPNYINTILVFGSFGLYLILLEQVGFIISTILYLSSQMYILAPKEDKTSKKILIYTVISIIVTMIIYWIFAEGFQLVLPRGMWL